jgi:ornithine cyclodeaminase/alanine dehydrogenase-like protein (mu-crystallin family)
MLHLDAQATAARLPYGRLIGALRTMFAQGCSVPPRHVHTLPGGTSLLMPAWRTGPGGEGSYGVKVVNVFAGNAARGLSSLHASYSLFDAATGVPLAVMDGSVLTTRRTVAASALAASCLARPDARSLLVVGAGRLAAELPWAYLAVRPGLTSIRVWNHRAATAQALAASLRAQGLPAEACGKLQEAVAEADIVSCATLATEPLVQGAWLRPGSHLDLVGSFTPQMRECDAAALAGASVFIDTDEALAKAGCLLQAIGEGRFSAAEVQARLAQLCQGQHPGRRLATERTVFKSVGTALEDLAAAELVWSLRETPAP